MIRIAAKTSIAVSAVVIFFTFAAVTVNSIFIERYYLYTKKTELDTVYEKLTAGGIQHIDKTIRAIESAEDVMIVYTLAMDDISILNEKLRTNFLLRGINLRKFWLWDKSYELLKKKGQVNQLYNQGIFRYSLLVKYMLQDGMVFAAGMIIPHITEAIGIVNNFTLMIFCIALVLIIFCIVFFVRRITRPLISLEHLAEDISLLQFNKLDLHTGDELESLVESINRMSSKLEIAHRELDYKNRSMQNLLSNVSHELKTPISLVKAYTAGIRDGLDDGTFLDIIDRQNERMHVLVEKLLELSRIEGTGSVLEKINPAECLKEILDTTELLFSGRSLFLHTNIDADMQILGDRAALKTIFTNLVSNAIAYSAGSDVSVSLNASASNIKFEIRNTVSDPYIVNCEDIWDPFYVGEKSRNRELAGSGLGLSIVKALCKKQGFDCLHRIEDNSIVFCIIFPKSSSFSADVT